MTHDDETVEREISKSPWPARVHLGGHVFQNSYDDGSYYCYELRASMKFADPAALSALPERELLREALDALTKIGALPRYTDGDNEAQDIARAAADKIRAAMGGEK